MGLFGGKETPPRGGTDHQKVVRAGRRQDRLMKAISDRGRSRGMTSGEIAKVQAAAAREIRRRGMGPEQMPYGDPVEDFDRYGI